MYQKSNHTSISHIVYSREFPGNNKITLSTGKKNFISFDFSPIAHANELLVNGRIRCDFFSEHFITSAYSSIRSKHANLSVRVDKKPCSLPVIDAKLSLGTERTSFHAQFCRIFEDSKSLYAFVLSHQIKNGETQVIFSNEKEKSLLVRQTYCINPGMKCGVMFRVGDEFRSLLKVAWDIKVNDSIIHSTVATSGIVSTVFTQKLHETCNFIVSCELNHIQRNYLCGIGLQWGC